MSLKIFTHYSFTFCYYSRRWQ